MLYQYIAIQNDPETSWNTKKSPEILHALRALMKFQFQFRTAKLFA